MRAVAGMRTDVLAAFSSQSLNVFPQHLCLTPLPLPNFQGKNPLPSQADEKSEGLYKKT